MLKRLQGSRKAWGPCSTREEREGLTPRFVDDERDGRRDEDGRRRRSDGQGDDELGAGVVMLLGAGLGCEEEAGRGLVPFPCSCGLDDDRSDGGETIKLRPWRSVREVQKKSKNSEKKNRGDLGEKGGRRRRRGRWLGHARGAAALL